MTPKVTSAAISACAVALLLLACELKCSARPFPTNRGNYPAGHGVQPHQSAPAWGFAQAGGDAVAGGSIRRTVAHVQRTQDALLQNRAQNTESANVAARGMNVLLLALVGATAVYLALLLLETLRRKRAEHALINEREENEKRISALQNSADQYKLIVENSQDGVWVVDRTGRTTYVNARVSDMLGYAPEEILGRKHTDFMDAEGREVAEENMRRRKEGSARDEDFRFVRNGGATLWTRVTTSPLTDAAGLYIGTLTMVTDYTQSRHVEKVLKLHDSAITASSNGVVIVDAQREDMPIVSVNPAFQQITGYRAAEVIGRAPFMLEGEDRAQRSLSALKLARKQGRDVHVESRNRRKDGSEYWNELFVAPIRDDGGVLTHFVAIQSDITARKNAVEALQRTREELEIKVMERTAELQTFANELQKANDLLTTLAAEDGLTGLKNRRIFQERLDQEVQRSLRYGAPLSLMLLDVDKFKQYNDAFGHPAGDQVLREVAKILQFSARQTDLVARYGGEEFAVIMINTDEANSTVLAERVRQSVESASWDLRQVTASIGVATLGMAITDPATLIGTADKALYFAKQHGRNQVACGCDLKDAADPQAAIPHG